MVRPSGVTERGQIDPIPGKRVETSRPSKILEPYSGNLDSRLTFSRIIKNSEEIQLSGSGGSTFRIGSWENPIDPARPSGKRGTDGP